MSNSEPTPPRPPKPAAPSPSQKESLRPASPSVQKPTAPPSPLKKPISPAPPAGGAAAIPTQTAPAKPASKEPSGDDMAKTQTVKIKLPPTPEATTKKPGEIKKASPTSPSSGKPTLSAAPVAASAASSSSEEPEEATSGLSYAVLGLGIVALGLQIWTFLS